MKSLFFILASAAIFCVNAQNSNQKTASAKTDPAKVAAGRAKMEKAYPPKAEEPVKSKAAAANTTKPATSSSNISGVKPFPFLGSFIVNFDSQSKLGTNNKGTIKYALDGFQAAMVPTFNLKEISAMRAVLDMREKEVTMLMTDTKGKKNGLLMKMPKPVLTNENTKSDKQPVITKTGLTKMIEGYKCEKIICQMGDSTKIESWVTNEINLNFSDLIGLTNSSFRGKSPFTPSDYATIKSAALETTVTRTNGDVMKMHVTEIKKIKPETTLFTTDGYKISDVRGLPMFGGQ